MGWEMALVAVHCLEASADRPRSCPADSKKDPTDWASVCRLRDRDGRTVAVHLLVVSPTTFRG
jgi:hypothetical protein